MYILYPKTKVMKISKTAVLTLWTVFVMAGLWLMVAYGAEKNLSTNLSNVIQHIEKVIFISTWDNTQATMNQTNGLVRINTENFILSTDDTNTINWIKSAILWWERNDIKWNHDVIFGGNINSISWNTSTILWWEHNVIEGNSSVIWWWRFNAIKWASSVILWSTGNTVSWGYSVVVWNNSSVNGTNSVALGANSHVKATNSFLWTDWNHGDEELEANNVFAVVSKSGMVINTNKAHPFAQLTIGWPIILSENTGNNKNIQCGGGIWWWIVKTVNSGWNTCLCSCDGSGWNSLFGLGKCRSVCDISIQPACSTDEPQRINDGTKHVYSWWCNPWTVVEWTWAYFMDKKWNLHWSCQTDDGTVVQCQTYDGIMPCIGDGCDDEWWECKGSIPEHAINVPHSDPDSDEENLLFPSEQEAIASNYPCAYFCDEENNWFYDPNEEICKKLSNPCKEDELWGCIPPFTTFETWADNGRLYWYCGVNGRKLENRECNVCDEWYYPDRDNEWHLICKPMTGCHHCAKSGFPYCFTIDFDEKCDEAAWWRSQH